jgi:hypothetical protein
MWLLCHCNVFNHPLAIKPCIGLNKLDCFYCLCLVWVFSALRGVYNIGIIIEEIESILS